MLWISHKKPVRPSLTYSDEAQNVADRGDHQALRARLAKLLAGRSDTMIMLSATPHDGKARSFASLMNMLDPTAIADPDDYQPEDVKGLFIRRFKKDIQDQSDGAFLERTVNLEHCRASATQYQANPDADGAVDPMENLSRPEDDPAYRYSHDEPEESPECKKVREYVDTELTPDQQNLYHDHFGAQQQLEEIRQREAGETGKMVSSSAMTNRKNKIVGRIAKNVFHTTPVKRHKTSKSHRSDDHDGIGDEDQDS